MLQAISKANHNSRFVYVMDTRPKVAAWHELGPAHQKNEPFKSQCVVAVFPSCS